MRPAAANKHRERRSGETGTQDEQSETCIPPVHHTLLKAQGLKHRFEVRNGHVRIWGCGATLMGPFCRLVLSAVSRSELMQVPVTYFKHRT